VSSGAVKDRRLCIACLCCKFGLVLGGPGEEFAYEDTGENERGTESGAKAETLAHNDVGGCESEYGFEGKDERGVRWRCELLRPGLYGEGDDGGEYGGDDDGPDDTWRPDDGWSLEDRRGYDHQEGADDHLHEDDLRVGKALGGAADEDDVEGEADGAANGERVADVDAAQAEEFSVGADGDGEQVESDERADDSEDGPAIDVAPPEEREEERHEDDGCTREECGFRWRGELQSGGLEFVAEPEEDSDDASGDYGGTRHAREFAVVDDGEERGGERHAHGVEEQGRHVRKCVLDENEGRAPDERDEYE
jgi:hypothetical protein